MEKYAPIIVFTYNRPDSFEKVLDNLKNCTLAPDSHLFIYSDGAKSLGDESNVRAVREIASAATGFRSISVHQAETNKGLATSIIEGVTTVVKQYGRVIVLEDDLIVSRNFLLFMNQSLEEFKDDHRIVSVSGFTPPLDKGSYMYDNYFTLRASSWGWGTWEDRWSAVDWKVVDYSDFKRRKENIREFNKMGSDLSGMLEQQMAGEISSWAIRFVYHQFKYKMYTVFPTLSKVQNIGFSSSSTHTKGAQRGRFQTVLDNGEQSTFRLRHSVELNRHFLKYFLKQFSVFTRVKYKLLAGLETLISKK